MNVPFLRLYKTNPESLSVAGASQLVPIACIKRLLKWIYSYQINVENYTVVY